jgi:hypothetical protein
MESDRGEETEGQHRRRDNERRDIEGGTEEER